MIAAVEQFPPDGQFPPAAAASEKSVPMPVRGTDFMPPASAIVTAAELLPVAAGENVTLMVQLAATDRLELLAGQVLVSEKSPLFVPVTEMLEIVSVALPVFVKVTFIVLLPVPTSW